MAAESVEEAQADAFDSLVTLPGSQAGQISASQITLASKAFLCLLITDQITSRKHLSGGAEGDGEGGGGHYNGSLCWRASSQPANTLEM